MSASPAARRAHRMPFGAEVREDGTTRFRLWAPGARQVELWLEEPGRAVTMPRDTGGWAEYVTPDARPGTRYRYRIDGDLLVPDPAARFQPGDVHGASEVVDPLAHAWTDTAWGGLPPERLVFYELHVGAFSPAGTYAGVTERLDHLAALGVTAVQLMPVADFPGGRGWGYDGVLLFAPEASYGRPEALKALVGAAHARGLAVFLDVVYNHFGPDGNYLHHYAPDFFNARQRTPWGDGVNYDGPGSEAVRAFMIHNALYWIEEYHLDGLRLDAVNAIVDESPTHLLVELGRAVADGPGRERRVHLVLENGANEARYLRRVDGRRPLYQAQWNDDVHHALHVLLTGERGGYYGDYQPPLPHLGRGLTEGFSFQGEYTMRKLSDIDATSPVPVSSLFDHGFFVQAMHMVIPKHLGLYATTSYIMDDFKRYPWEVSGGASFYPYGSRSWRLNLHVIRVEKSPAGSSFGYYVAGQSGTTISIGTDILL